jgi:hypothetical protein
VLDTGSNNWDDGAEGNYFSLYSGEDKDNDGIGDTPYYIGRYNFDRFPLMFTQMEDLKILITYPVQGFFHLRNYKIFPILFTTILIGSCEINAKVHCKNLTEIDRVEFYIDKVLKEIDTNLPYEYFWEEKSFGKHVLKAMVYTNNGNYSSDEFTLWKFS